MDDETLDPKRFAKHDTATVLKMLRACEMVNRYLVNSVVKCDLNVYVKQLVDELESRGVEAE